MTKFLKGLLLITGGFFFIFAPYETKYFGKAFFIVGGSVIFLVSLLAHKIRFYRGFFLPNPFDKSFLIFAIACLIAIILSRNPYASQAVFFDRHLVYFIFFISGVFLVSGRPQKLFFLIPILMFSGFIFALGGVSDYFQYRVGNPAIVARLWSVFGKPIPYYGLPLYLTYFIPFNFSLFMFARNKWFRFIGFVIFVLASFCLIMNTSRAAWLAVFLAMIFVFSLRIKKSKPVILTVLALFVFLSLVIPNKQERFKTILDPSQWSDRLPLYKAAIAIFRDYPLWGVGVGMFEKALHYPKYELVDSYPVAKELNLHAHNTYLEIAAEMGLFGLLSFLGIFVSFFWKAIKKIRNPGDMPENTQAIFLGLSGSVFAALVFAFSTTYITVGVNNSCYFWLLFGMAAGMLDKKDELKAGTVP